MNDAIQKNNLMMEQEEERGGTTGEPEQGRGDKEEEGLRKARAEERGRVR